MAELYSSDPMLEMYIFETSQNLEQLEAVILSCEKTNNYGQEAINEIFRIMHTIKGSSAMMLFTNISTLAHAIEDLFFYLREQNANTEDNSKLTDLVLGGVDFIKVELYKVKNGEAVDGECANLIESIREYLSTLKKQVPGSMEERLAPAEKQLYYIASNKTALNTNHNIFKTTVYFEEGCEMENIRAYTIIHGLKERAEEIYFIPENIIDNDESVDIIRKQGFVVYLKTVESYEEINKYYSQTLFLRDMEMVELESDEELKPFIKQKQRVIEESPVIVPKISDKEDNCQAEKETHLTSANQSIISVNVSRLDKLMDLVGELVIAEAMVTQNPDLNGLELNNFHKAARQLRKITGEIQDMVMNTRMVPLATTFHKMNRIVRDMCRKLNKEVQLQLIGEETEVDKNIIENISDPLMHLVRNSIDHGIEAAEDRQAVGKPAKGIITLEAKGSGSDVLIIVKDDGRGLNREKIINRAKENGLLNKPENDMTDREIFNLIFLPGFSTKEKVSEFSGRGVGMDVVVKNIEKVGGTVSVDSAEGIGSTVTLKIPLTLAIIDGMNVKVGGSCYTIPITSIRESFRPKASDLIQDPDGNEMIMVRGQCYPILRLYEHFGVKPDITEFTEGILIMVEQDEKTLCIFADQLLGQQQVVVKTLPSYIRNTKRISGLTGCTLLGDGNISLILDIGGLLGNK